MPKPLKVTRANEIVGLFILLAVAVAIAALFLGPQTQRWFTPSRTVVIHLPPEGSLGLRRGGEVQILGSVVGSVDDIFVTDAGEMEARVSIQGDFIRFVRSDSRAIIRKPLGIGDAEIEITRGTGAPLPTVGAAIQAEADKAPTAMMEEALAIVREEALPTIKELRGAIAEFTQLAAELRGQQAAITQALNHVNRVGAQLDRGDGLAAMLISDPKPAAELRAALPKLNRALDELRTTLAGAKAFSDRLPKVGDEMHAAVRNARLASADARRLMASLPELQDSAKRAFDAAPGVLLQSQQTLYEIERLTEGFQRSWLVRDHIDAPPAGHRLSSGRVGTER